MKKILAALAMLILVPIDYIVWNLSYKSKVTIKQSIKECWGVLSE